MSLFNQSEKAYLLLADGTVFEGRSFGAKGTVTGEVVFTTGDFETAYGEVVFNTSITGYLESITDPSYCGQILVQTFPLIGNYGVNDEDFESARSYVSGYIVREWCNTPSNFRCQGTIEDFLIKQNIIGIHSIDTRSLTRKIREVGVMNGIISTEDVYENKDELLKSLHEYKVRDAVKNVTGTEFRTYCGEAPKYKVALFDFGYKRNIRNELVKRGCEVTVVPAYTTAEEIKEISPDGIMLSNGPGDPTENTEIIENIKKTVPIRILPSLIPYANIRFTCTFKTTYKESTSLLVPITVLRTF